MDVKNNSDPNLYRVLLPDGNNLLREVPSMKKEPVEKMTSDDVFIIDAKLWRALIATGRLPKKPSSNKVEPFVLSSSPPLPVTPRAESEPIISIQEDEELNLEVVQPASSMPETSVSSSAEYGFLETRSEEVVRQDFIPIDPSMLESRFNPHRPIFIYNKNRKVQKYVMKMGDPPTISKKKQHSDRRRRH